MTGSHTRWARPEAQSEDPERIAIREALAFGKAVYDRRVALGLSVAELGLRAGMTTDEIECIEEGGTEATIPLLRRLACCHRRRGAGGLAGLGGRLRACSAAAWPHCLSALPRRPSGSTKTLPFMGRPVKSIGPTCGRSRGRSVLLGPSRTLRVSLTTPQNMVPP